MDLPKVLQGVDPRRHVDLEVLLLRIERTSVTALIPCSYLASMGRRRRLVLPPPYVEVLLLRIGPRIERFNKLLGRHIELILIPLNHQAVGGLERGVVLALIHELYLPDLGLLALVQDIRSFDRTLISLVMAGAVGEVLIALNVMMMMMTITIIVVVVVVVHVGSCAAKWRLHLYAGGRRLIKDECPIHRFVRTGLIESVDVACIQILEV